MKLQISLERHDSVLVFVELFKSIVSSLQDLSLEVRTSSATATTLLAAVEKSEFLVSLMICEKLLSHTLPLSKFLQSSLNDLVSALNYAKDIICVLKNLKKGADSVFKEIFVSVSNLSLEIFDAVIKVPRLAGKQTQRANYSINSPEDYYRISIFLACIDQLIISLKNRFSENETVLSAFYVLLPGATSPEKAHFLDDLPIIWKTHLLPK